MDQRYLKAGAHFLKVSFSKEDPRKSEIPLYVQVIGAGSQTNEESRFSQNALNICIPSPNISVGFNTSIFSCYRLFVKNDNKYALYVPKSMTTRLPINSPFTFAEHLKEGFGKDGNYVLFEKIPPFTGDSKTYMLDRFSKLEDTKKPLDIEEIKKNKTLDLGLLSLGLLIERLQQTYTEEVIGNFLIGFGMYVERKKITEAFSLKENECIDNMLNSSEVLSL